MASESDTLKKDFEELRASVNKIEEDLKAIRDAQAEELKASARDSVRKAREGVQDVASEIGSKTRESAETVENLVRENPVRSMLAAFGLGLLIAQLLRRR